MNDKARLAKAARILDNYADALRGDWGSIDGRSERRALNELTTFMRGDTDICDEADLGVCVKGPYGAHWFNNGFDHDCVDELI
jgi:hypothetical protein